MIETDSHKLKKLIDELKGMQMVLEATIDHYSTYDEGEFYIPEKKNEQSD